jgi:crotonobetainyl-CoA:carnitine CoA-transferase CaiB-like acyl-CoA transferase
VIRHYDPMKSEAMSAFSMGLNRNKRSIVLDLKSAAGHQAMIDLVATADVFATSMRRGALERLGLSSEELRGVKPDLIYCIANGYGSDGPYADKPAFDDVIQSVSGLASMFERTAGQPMLVPSIMADKVCGIHIAAAISASLVRKATTGLGDHVEVPMAETMAAFNMVEHLGGRTYEPQHGDFSYARVMTPNRKPRRTADGWMVILPYSDRNWRAFFTHAGRPELADDERFVSGRSRIAHSDEIYGLLDDLVTARTTQEWLDICDAESIPCAPVLDLENIDADEHFDAVGLLQVEEHPTEGMFRYARDPIIMESNTPVLKHYPPRLGSDTVQVLEEIGYTSIQIDAITEGKA